jgi:beta-hydroxylase
MSACSTRCSASSYEVHLASRKVKEWNRKVYYALKYSLMIGIVALIVASALR